MTVPQFSEFELLLIRSGNEVGTAVLLLLAWIAASDGRIDEEEAESLQSILEASSHGHAIEPILKISTAADLQAIQLAAEVVRIHFTGEKASLFMQMAIGMAIADGYLTASENYILRFLADLVGLTEVELNEAFVEVTSKPIPELPDPSTAEWWTAKEQRRQDQNGSHSESNRSQASPSSKANSERVRALAILGLEEDASPEEIKKTYRRLAQVHHPDRFVSLGNEAVAAASLTFKRIKDAYDYLNGHA